MKSMKNCLLIIASISFLGMVACSEESPATEQELSIAKAWLTCTQLEKWDEVYNQIGTLGKNVAVRKECGAEPPYVPDD